MCPNCKKTLLARDLVPILSFLFLKGHCRHCRKKISIQYPLVEAATAVVFVVATLFRFGNPVQLPIDWVIMSLLMALAVFDFRYGLLPDALTLPAIGFVVLARLVLSTSTKDATLDMLLAAGIGFVFFAIQWIISKGRWIGDGDIRLGVLMGAMLGYPGILLALLISYAIGSVVSIALILVKLKQWNSRIALGPFLVVGTVIVYYSQDQLLWFLGF